MKSFLQGKKTLETPSLRPPVGLTPPPGVPRCDAKPSVSVSTPGASNAQVEVVKEGDKVVRLIVTCVCGERVEIDCLYPAGGR